MLTIGQLAAFAGVTVRAIRHYHQRGLLSEPGRDASGYRRYDGQAVIDLLRIATLARAGVRRGAGVAGSPIQGVTLWGASPGRGIAGAAGRGCGRARVVALGGVTAVVMLVLGAPATLAVPAVGFTGPTNFPAGTGPSRWW